MNPIKCEYTRGIVGRIFAPAGVSATVLNIYRGIFNMLHISMKKNANVYDLHEVIISHVPQNSTQEKKIARSLTFDFFFCLQISLELRVCARHITSSMRTERLSVSY